MTIGVIGETPDIMLFGIAAAMEGLPTSVTSALIIKSRMIGMPAPRAL
jgi:hypothetical protein